MTTTNGTHDLKENDAPSPSVVGRRLSVTSTGVLRLTDTAGVTTPVSGGGGGGAGSFTDVPLGQTKTINAGEQVIFYGPMTVEGTLYVIGSLVAIVPPETVQEIPVVSSGPTAVPNNSYVPVDPSSGPLTIQLPNSGPPGQTVTVKNETSSLNVITVDGMGRKIDGAYTKTLTTANEILRLQRKSNQNWTVIS
jgi:hypothetical protein